MGTILFLFIAGILLLLVEIYLTPGATIFGAIGIIGLVISNVMAFQQIEGPTKWLFPAFTLFALAVFFYLLYQLITSKKYSVQSVIDSKVNVLDEQHFLVGEIGTTITALRPSGNVEFAGERVEVFTRGEYIEEHKEVRIFKRTKDKIFVELNN